MDRMGVGLLLLVFVGVVPTALVVAGLWCLCQALGIPGAFCAVGLANLLPARGPAHVLALLTRPAAVLGLILAVVR